VSFVVDFSQVSAVLEQASSIFLESSANSFAGFTVVHSDVNAQFLIALPVVRTRCMKPNKGLHHERENTPLPCMQMVIKSGVQRSKTCDKPHTFFIDKFSVKL
jgi:hypothetical protein